MNSKKRIKSCTNNQNNTTYYPCDGEAFKIVDQSHAT